MHLTCVILSGVTASLREGATESKDPSASSGKALLLVCAKMNVERHSHDAACTVRIP